MSKEYKFALSSIMSVIVVLLFVLVMYYTRTYTVILDTQGGSMMQSLEVKPNTILERPVDPIKEGYVFDGWYYADSGKDYAFDQPIKNDLHIKARWKSIM